MIYLHKSIISDDVELCKRIIQNFHDFGVIWS